MAVDHFISVTASSRTSPQERKLDGLMNQLQPAETLIVSELSRVGRSVGEVITTLDTLVKRQVRVMSVKEGLDLQGETDLKAKVMITLFSLFAEVERELISSRTKEALAAARANGKTVGRPKGSRSTSKLDGRKEEIQKLLALKVSKTSIAKITGVDRSTLQHFIRSRGLV